jgi:hypothetical protein
MAGIWGNIEDDEPQGGLLGGLQRGFTNPLTLGGLALLSGEGFGGAAQGMRMGMGFDEQRRADQQRRQYQGLLQDPSVTGAIPPEMLKIAQMAGPSGGPEFLAKYLDPARTADLDYKKALTQKAQREAAGGSTKYGKTGAVFQDPNTGAFYTMQFAEDGTTRIAPVQVPSQASPPAAPAPDSEGVGRFSAPAMASQQAPIPLVPARGVDVVGDEMYSRSTGAPVRNVGSNLSEAERQKKVGQETGERQMAQPKAFAAMTSADAKSDVVLKTIAEARQMVGPYTAGFGGATLKNLPGTAARDLSAKLDTLKANAGFAELQTMRDNSPTGGALGQVAVQELAMLQATITSLEQAQTPKQLSDALVSYETFIRESKVRRKQAYEATYAGAGSSQAPASPNDGWTDVGGVRIREKR